MKMTKKVMKNKQIIKTDKFITDYSYVARVIPFAYLKENPALVNIYAAVLLKSLKNVQGSLAFHDYMHANYGASLNCRIQRFNDYFYFGIRFECINKKYLPDSYDAFSSLVELVRQAFLEKPYFNEELVEKNKKELISYIRKNKKSPYARCYRKVFKQLDEDHPINFNSLGNVEQVSKVNVKKLYEFHKKISSCPLTYIYQGNNEFGQYELLKETFKDDFELPKYVDIPLKRREYVYGEETKKAPNTNVIMLYGFNMPYSLKNTYIYHFFDKIVGGSNSILFDEIREKRGLCYSISSLTYTSENVVEIDTQISKKNTKYLIESVDEVIKNFEKYFNEYYFQKAKMDIISEIVDRYDNPNEIFTHNLVLLYKRDRISDFQVSMEELNKVTYQDIIDFAKSLVRVSTYAVKGDM